MKSIHSWFEEYAVSHQNHTNKLIHWICVPLIFWSLVLMASSLPAPFKFLEPAYLHWGLYLIIPIIFFYIRLSPPLSIGIIIFSVICIQLTAIVYYIPISNWVVGLVIFAAAWVGQFVGHKIEGKKPSFLKDIQFLLIGPAWLLSFIYNRLGIRY